MKLLLINHMYMKAVLATKEPLQRLQKRYYLGQFKRKMNAQSNSVLLELNITINN